MSERRVELGLRENLAQFGLLVAINAFVGAMVGLERSTLPLIGETDFGLASKAAVLSFIVAFGLAKALTNLGAGALAQRLGRRRLLIAGWAIALPVPLLIAIAPSWGWIVAANVLLGINQGLAWSMTVVMKIDLVGPERRGFALGLNEAAGYGGVAVAAAVSGWLAAEFAPRDVLVAAGAGIALLALVLSACVRPRHRRARRARAAAASPAATSGRRRCARRSPTPPGASPRCAPARRPGWSTTSTTRSPGGSCRCSSPPTAPSVGEIGLVAGIYPAVWGVGTDLDRPLVRPHRAQAADRRRHAPAGRRARRARRSPTAPSASPPRAAALLGVGTALVYPTLIAAISDAVSPVARAPAVGIYRFWRDMGYVVGGLLAGAVADALGYGGAIAIVAGLTAASGLWVAWDLPTPRRPAPGMREAVAS